MPSGTPELPNHREPIRHDQRGAKGKPSTTQRLADLSGLNATERRLVRANNLGSAKAKQLFAINEHRNTRVLVIDHRGPDLKLAGNQKARVGVAPWTNGQHLTLIGSTLSKGR